MLHDIFYLDFPQKPNVIFIISGKNFNHSLKLLAPEFGFAKKRKARSWKSLMSTRQQIQEDFNVGKKINKIQC